MATRLGAAPIRRARQLLSAAATTVRSVAVAVPAMAWLWIFRSGAQSPQRQQPARRQTHEFSWWKGGVTMRGCPSTGSGVPCCARLLRRLSRATTPARRDRGYLANVELQWRKQRVLLLFAAYMAGPDGRGGGGDGRMPLRASLLRSVSPLTQRCSPLHVSHRKWSVRGQLSLSVRTTTWLG